MIRRSGAAVRIYVGFFSWSQILNALRICTLYMKWCWCLSRPRSSFTSSLKSTHPKLLPRFQSRFHSQSSHSKLGFLTYLNCLYIWPDTCHISFSSWPMDIPWWEIPNPSLQTIDEHIDQIRLSKSSQHMTQNRTSIALNIPSPLHSVLGREGRFPSAGWGLSIGSPRL